MLLVNIAIRKDDVVHTLIDARLCIMAEVVERLTKALFTFLYVEEDREFLSVKALISYITQYVELSVGQYRLRQAHHLAVRSVWR